MILSSLGCHLKINIVGEFKLDLMSRRYVSSDGYQSFRIHGSFVPRPFVPRLRRFVATFDQFVPNPLDDSYPTNYDTKCLKQRPPKVGRAASALHDRWTSAFA